MKAQLQPLQLMALGVLLLAVQLTTPDGGVLPVDPIGWLLVLLALNAVPPGTMRRGALAYVALIAAAVSVVLAVPAVQDVLEDAEESLQWAVDLPRFLFLGLLSQTLGRLSAEHGNGFGAGLFGLCLTAITAAALLPILIFGAGVGGLEGTATALAQLTPLVIAFGLLFVSGHEWAGARVTSPE